ncbi:hypothetical protein SteCoe_14227 [Stentor coeruleus]|uniref:Uncharacterized protein n=1 Tax=Stentor coeruleus TaxID=5963 RepID=A0A1R2C6H7_9CILI|nr:hypothetical protein SteCoe_14227 [Stentor coeruleus]
MCKSNILCQSLDGKCACKPTAFQSGIVKPVPVPMTVPSDSNFMGALFKMIVQQNEFIKSIADQTKSALEKISELTEKRSGNMAQPTSIVSEEATTPSVLLRYLCADKTYFTHSLELGEKIPMPAYKERSFSVLVNILDSNGNKVRLPNSIVFKVMLYTADNPPKNLSINTSGDKIMRGTLEVEGNSEIFFKKIIIKEVTSHFRNGSFFFVVVPKDAGYIKPLIVEDFVIKARKITNECPKKKCKVQEEILNEKIYD